MLLFGVEIGSDEECLVSDAAETRKAVYSTEYYTFVCLRAQLQYNPQENMVKKE